MLQATFAAFQDELIKIAASAPIFQPLPTRKPAGMHLQGVGPDMSGAAKPPTVAARGQMPVERTGVVAPPKPPVEMTKTHIRPGAVPHTPLPHPAVPGGMAHAASSIAQKGRGLLKTHGKKGLVGLGMLGSEVLVNKMMGGRSHETPG